MKSEKNPNFHIFLLIGAFGLALAFRLIRLGVYPLGDLEAEIALQAQAAAQGTQVKFGPFMSAVGLTGINFFIFTSSNFLARFWTAIFGTCIVFVPFLYREKLGYWPATVASLALAIAPDMVGLSRIVGSPIMALVCLLSAVGLFLRQKSILSGVMLALGLMSGAGFWLGTTILILSGLAFGWLFKENRSLLKLSLTENKNSWVKFVLSFITTIGVIGTSFFLAPGGLAGVFSGLVSFVEGFRQSYTSPFFLLPLSLILYTLPALILGIWGSLRGLLIRSEVDLFLLVWWVVGIIVVFLYPGSNPADIVWVTFPLWILAARVLCFTLHLPEDNRLVMNITSVVVVLIFAFIFLALRSLGSQALTREQQVSTLIAVFGGAVLLVAIVLMVNFGWSEEIALPGLLIGLAVVFSAMMISMSVKSSSLGSEGGYAFWYPDEPSYSTKWLQVSLERVFDMNKTITPAIEIAVTDYQSPAMVWALRNYAPVHFDAFVPPQFQPGIIITDVEESPELTNSYRGQDLVWSQQVAWQEMTAAQYFQWFLSSAAPTLNEEIIFWVRTDLMTDGQFVP